MLNSYLSPEFQALNLLLAVNVLNGRPACNDEEEETAFADRSYKQCPPCKLGLGFKGCLTALLRAYNGNIAFVCCLYRVKLGSTIQTQARIIGLVLRV